ncbi:ornithine cyclodeaminase family protein [Agromyces sp. LHK192]|uniref:ornithine cyclodeaminase family protein n=1 Tax=Agromyces sp. LHK192 TaxID=2498704 RepID=UPI000FD861E6|nr:ornithine cyclodeaminase family protein [Agromyces sp. LHK192]
MTMSIPFLDAAAMRSALPPAAAVAAIRAVLAAGFAPSSDRPRSAVPLTDGELLIMPSEVGETAGIKVLTVAPSNPRRGMPRIQGLYVLFDPQTLAPRLLLDGAALTTIRTPAVSIAAVEPMLRRGREPLRVVVYGAGPQARAHVETLRAVLGPSRTIEDVTFVTRSPAGSAAAYSEAADSEAAGSKPATEATARAGLIICATTAREPVFDSRILRPDAIVIAVGSHEADARELDSALMARATVVVEDAATARRECGDVVLAVAEGALDPERLVAMDAVIRGEASIAAGRPIVFKSSGMSWEDLVIAEAIARAREVGR